MQEVLSKIALLQSAKTAENRRKPQSGFPDVVPLQSQIGNEISVEKNKAKISKAFLSVFIY